MLVRDKYIIDPNVCKGLLQPICLVIIKYLIGFLAKNTPLLRTYFCDHTLSQTVPV